jgi:tetratricopeptide (TPR) repeat protein
MAAPYTANEEAQLLQTIEMFEVITQSQPQDYQSLEILKEAYLKLERTEKVLETSKRIASAYAQLGQLSSAIMEYESILQKYPDDPDVLAALGEIESRAENVAPSTTGPILDAGDNQAASNALAQGNGPVSLADIDDGRQMMRQYFVDSKLVSAADFDGHWPAFDLHDANPQIKDPFIQILADRGILPLEKSLKVLCDKSRLGYLPLEKYDVDIELARTFPRETCRRWSVLPIDRLSKSVLVATANPFNKQAIAELERTTNHRLLWYISPPAELSKLLRKIFR